VSLLADWFLELIGSAGGPSTERGLVATFSTGSIALTAGTVWLVMTSSDPIRQPEWGLAVFAGTLLCGAGGLLVSFLHLRRNESDRLFGILSATVNLAGVATPVLWMIAR
jgi:hypothetical protein